MAQRDRVYRREDIVYYHELDNNNEAIQNEDWDGHNQAVSGIIVSGMAPVPISAISGSFQTPEVDFVDARNDNMYLRSALLTEDKIVLAYRDTTSQGKVVIGNVVETSSGCDISYGTPVVFSPAVISIGLAPLTSGKFVLMGRDDNVNSNVQQAWVGTTSGVSGLEINLTSGSVPAPPDDFNGFLNCQRIDESGFVSMYRSTGGPTSKRPKVVACRLSGVNDTQHWGSSFQLNSSSQQRQMHTMIDLGYDARRRKNKTLCLWVNDQNDRPTGRVIEYSGTSGITISAGTAFEFDDVFGGDMCGAHLGNDKCVVGFYRGDTSTAWTTVAIQLSGIELGSSGNKVIIEDDASNFEQNGMDIIRLGPDQFLAAYDRASNDDVTVTSGVVSGTTINILGAQTVWSSGSAISRYVRAERLSPTGAVIFIGEDSDNKILTTCGTTIINSELQIPNGGGGGGTLTGSTNIGVGFWAQNPTANTSTLNINAGQSITYTDDTISLNNGVFWDVSSLDLNDGEEHLVLLEFTNTSGDNWELQVSIDGSGFQSLGEGSGTTNTQSGVVGTSVTYSTADPSGTSGQFIDELLIWGSDEMIFNDEVADNMFFLGQSGIPQGQYLNFFPSGASGDIGLYIAGNADENCFLGSGNVIYYHPLDDFYEGTEFIPWSGSGAFVPGQIGDANSAIAQGVSWAGADTTIDSDVAFDCSVYKVGDDKFLAAYRNASASTAGSGILRLGVASGLDTDNRTITWSSGVSFHDPGANEIRIGSLVYGETALLTYRDPFNNQDGAETIIISGTTPELSGNRSLFKSTSHSHVDMAVLNSGNFWVSWQEGGTGAGTGRVGAIDANGTITYGGESGWLGGTIQGAGKRILRVDDTHAVAMNNGIQGRVVLVGELDGGIGATSMRWGAGTEFIHDDTGISDQKMEVVSGTKFMATYAYSIGGGGGGLESQKAYSRIFEVDTSTLDITITSGNQDAIFAGGSDPVATIGLMGLFNIAPSRMMFYRGTETKIGKIVDDNTTWGTKTTAPAHNNVATGPDATQWVASASSGEALMVYGNSANSDALTYSFGVLEFSANITSSFAYPDGSGNDHIATAFWTRNPSSGDASVSVTRDFTINVSSGQIDLDGSVVWSGSAIDTLTAQLNTSSNVFVVLDAEHTSGGNWVLKTSLNGSAFTDQGSGVGTKLPAAFSSNDAALMLDNPDGEDQWIDELILWAGGSGFSTFTTEELGNLYDLGNTLGLPMYQYCLADFSSEEEGEGTTEFSTIEDLIKNFNYNPQIIGKFTSMAATTATIEVWDITNGQEQALSLTTNACYAIANTGRFGWDTKNLPPQTDRTKQYAYRMTSNLGETFEGQFTVSCYNFRPEHRIRNRRR